jgi:NifU-like protein involved in Fe-S cluster formation
MDEKVVKYYRRLCKTGFEHAGELPNPAIFLDTVGEQIRICAQVTNTFIHVYIDVREGVIEDCRYLCTCDPTANVAVELLCALIKGKTITQAEALSAADFSRALGSEGEEFVKKATATIELLHRGIARYKACLPVKIPDNER